MERRGRMEEREPPDLVSREGEELGEVQLRWEEMRRGISYGSMGGWT